MDPIALQVKAFLGASWLRLHLVAGKKVLFHPKTNQRRTNQIDCCSFLEHPVYTNKMVLVICDL